jgi:hypothetical protein
VEPVDIVSPDVTRLLAAKEARRRKLAGLSYPDKVRAVVRLQRIVEPLLRARGRQVYVWKIEESTAPRS